MRLLGILKHHMAFKNFSFLLISIYDSFLFLSLLHQGWSGSALFQRGNYRFLNFSSFKFLFRQFPDGF